MFVRVIILPFFCFAACLLRTHVFHLVRAASKCNFFILRADAAAVAFLLTCAGASHTIIILFTINDLL